MAVIAGWEWNRKPGRLTGLGNKSDPVVMNGLRTCTHVAVCLLTLSIAAASSNVLIIRIRARTYHNSLFMTAANIHRLIDCSMEQRSP